MAPSSVPKILMVEDSHEFRDLWRERFEEAYPEGCALLFAAFVSEALDLLKANPDVDLVIVDGQIGSERRSELGTTFAREARTFYRGPMVAASSVREMNDMLVDAGCDIRPDSKAFVVAQALKALAALGKPPARP